MCVKRKEEPKEEKPEPLITLSSNKLMAWRWTSTKHFLIKNFYTIVKRIKISSPWDIEVQRFHEMSKSREFGEIFMCFSRPRNTWKLFHPKITKKRSPNRNLARVFFRLQADTESHLRRNESIGKVFFFFCFKSTKDTCIMMKIFI